MRKSTQRLALVVATGLALAGCKDGMLAFPPVVAQTAAKVDPVLQRLCDTAMGLAPYAPSIAVWTVPACGAAEAIVRLAQDPSSVEWLNTQIIPKSRALAYNSPTRI